MVTIFEEAAAYFRYIAIDTIDPRTSVLPLVGSPFPVLAILIVYYLTVTKWGPEYMERRKPFQLDRIIQLYNVVQIVVCGYIAYIMFTEYYSPWGKYNWICQPVDYSVSDEAMRTLYLAYAYYISKYVDLLDTIFFVLRKKQKQVSFLHLYHHMIMIAVVYVGMKYVPGGNGAFLVAMNTLVHTVMYTYYLLSNMFKGNQTVLRMKKHITELQLFAMFTINALGQLILTPDCNYPRNLIIALSPQHFFMFGLFLRFYKKTYFGANKKHVEKRKD